MVVEQTASFKKYALQACVGLLSKNIISLQIVITIIKIKFAVLLEKGGGKNALLNVFFTNTKH